MVTGKRPRPQFKKVRQVWGGNVFHSFQQRMEKQIKMIDQNRKFDTYMMETGENKIGRLWEGF